MAFKRLNFQRLCRFVDEFIKTIIDSHIILEQVTSTYKSVQNEVECPIVKEFVVHYVYIATDRGITHIHKMSVLLKVP